MADDRIFGYSTTEEEKDDKVQPESPLSPEDRLFSYSDKVDQTTTQAESYINVTRDLNPEQEAENYDLSKKSGLPLKVVRDDPKAVKDKLEFPTFTIDNPSPIKKYIGNKHLNAALSGDDIPQLENVQTAWEKTTLAFEEGDINAKVNILIARRELLGFNPEKVNQQIEELNQRRSELEPFEAKGFMEKVLTSTAGILPQQLMAAERGLERVPLGTAIAGAAALILGQIPPLTAFPEETVIVPTLAGGAYAGFAAGRIESMFMQEFGGSWQEFSNIKDKAGNNLDPALVKVMSFGVGTVNSLLEHVSFTALLGTFPGAEQLADRITPQFIRNIVAGTTLRAKLAQIATRAGIAWTAEEISIYYLKGSRK